ncbi:hypothetical protein PHISP_04690 [Aspergillus sp. HF37]|nr:hypothetical protein PHISP_04690 [Aspergillus sp. HF37]
MSFSPSSFGEEIHDADEESFHLFSLPLPSHALGFLDARSPSVDVSVHARDFAVRQSPTVLSSTRKGGTTGAVLWSVTPRLAAWLSAPSCPLRTASVVNPCARVVELGCGVSGLLALCLGPLVGKYLATDQEYVRRVFCGNVRDNAGVAYGITKKRDDATRGKKKKGSKRLPASASASDSDSSGVDGTEANITFSALDWELDEPSSLKDCIDPGAQDRGFDLLLSCDCVYNDALVAPFVRACAEICRLRPRSSPTVCVIAQQLRAPEVLEAWLRETLNEFRVWRVSDEVLDDGLKMGSGYVVHLLLLREDRAVD